MENSSIFWAQFGRASWKLARLLPTLPPPVLIMSNPRSGSSWVGEVLGSARNALYLREPLTQTTIDFGITWDQVKLNPQSPPPAYQRSADAAFLGLPIFHPKVVAFPRQWKLFERWRCRLVIKEINLAAFALLAEHHRPRFILLVRHPASVMLSYRQLGWLPAQAKATQTLGRHHGAYLRLVWDRLQSYPDHKVVLYEDICLDPINQFRQLYAFAGLQWNSMAEQNVRQHSQERDRDDNYGTYRDSQSLIAPWRDGLSLEDRLALREVYAAYDLPWYRSDDEW